jgi:SHS2 domain-containing protein
MDTRSSSGFREIEHTADWELEVWAPSLVELLERAALGMYELAGVKIAAGERISREFKLENNEPEMLLVDFLNELLFYIEAERLAFDHFQLQIRGDEMECKAEGSIIDSMDKEIKAATFHNLEVNRSERGLVANIVFDV